MAEEIPSTISVTINNKVHEIPAPDDEEKYLEKLVFGDSDGFNNNLKNIDNLYSNDLEEEESNGFNYSDSDDNDEFLNSLGNKQEYGFDEIDNENDKSDEDADDDMEKLNDDQLFFNDSDAMDVDVDLNSDDSESDNESVSSFSDAWSDSDDENLAIDVTSVDRLKKLRNTEDERFITGSDYISRLKKQYNSTFKIPEWASHKYEEEIQENDDDDDNKNSNTPLFDKVGSSKRSVISSSSNPLIDFLAANQTYNITNASSKLLNPDHLNIDRLIDANIKKISKSGIQSLSFHPLQPLLLTGGYDRTLRIYHVDGKTNNLITSLHLRQSPVQTCSFNVDEDGTTSILSGGRRKYMYKWNIDLSIIEKITRMYGNENRQKSFEYFKLSGNGKFLAIKGNNSLINLLSIKTGQWLNNFKIEGHLVDFEFFNNDDSIMAINTTGEVFEFDLKNGKILNRWNDSNNFGITILKMSKNGKFLAVGSNNGIVNIYDRFNNNKLIKAIDNLTTSISSLEFSHDSQVLCIASRAKRDSLKLVHLPSCTVFKNWPTNMTPLGKVTAVAFSPNGGFLATGNEQGRVRLWRLLDL